MPTGFGVPIGTVLHEFELPDLDGRQHLRSEWLGERLLVTFVNPRCRHSRRLLADLGRLLTHAAPTWPHVVLVSTGPVEENRRLVADTALADRVLVQEEMEVGALFEVDRTPAAYLVDDDGRTASPLIAGSVAILGLAATSTSEDGDAPIVEPQSPELIEAVTTPAPINGSRYLHGGLDVGSVAPDFRLPGLDGTEVALGRYRGRRVLLVFTDPVWSPCEAVAPVLERAHRSDRGPAVIIVARGGEDANRTWAQQHGLTLPIGLQSRWDLSREYGVLATPIAYVLDERGAVAAPIALGEDAILDLASGELTDPHPA
jgi:peroxiredoxin